MMKIVSTLAAGLLLTGAAAAQDGADAITYPFDGTFEEATFAVESAIINQGLVIDYVSHVGDMLNRTGKDVGSDKKIFDAADVFLFCSALLSRQVMEQDPMNVVHCPYGVFVIDQEGAVKVGFRDLPDGAMQPVEDILHKIAKEATGG